MSNTWTFSQVNGSFKIELEGYAAPFGRPRIGPVVTSGKTLRHERVRYPGNSGDPTTHLFGTQQNDWELHGRWMDKFLGEGAALNLVRQFNEMIEGQKQVRITWGDFLSYRGFIESLDVQWESQKECAWTLKILIDSDELEKQVVKSKQPKTPARLVEDVNQWLAAAVAPTKKSLTSLNTIVADVGDALTALDDALSTANEVGAAVVAVARGINNFEDATYHELERVRASVNQLKTAALILQSAIDNAEDHSVIIDRQAQDDIAWAQTRLIAAQATVAVLRSASEADSAALASSVRRVQTTYIAKPGDTWEWISVLYYGGASHADAIRQANGIRYGDKPIPGKTYIIPSK